VRNIPITPSLQASPKILEILVIRTNHPTELIMSLLNKFMECGMLNLNISKEGCLLLLDGQNNSMHIRKHKGG